MIWCAGDGSSYVSHCLHKQGLAIIVTCDYTDDHKQVKVKKLKKLKGTKKDGEKMKETLENLNFHILLLQNEGATSECIKREMKNVGDFFHQNTFEAPMKKVIIFVFSGHGSDRNTIIAQDGMSLCLKEDIIPYIANEDTLKTPKLLFIDACRGVKEMVWDTKGAGEQEAGLKTNYRVDYATIEGYVSYVDNVEGSRWLLQVAQKIKEEVNMSLQDIMAEVNKTVWEESLSVENKEVRQQPHTEDRLNCGRLYLHPQHTTKD